MFCMCSYVGTCLGHMLGMCVKNAYMSALICMNTSFAAA